MAQRIAFGQRCASLAVSLRAGQQTEIQDLASQLRGEVDHLEPELQARVIQNLNRVVALADLDKNSIARAVSYDQQGKEKES